ncbi:MAG: hypothetical protein VX675_06065 [Planctomycetota bacterium]|nr:hypothetical protein [Planctomycetota bacterium]
MKNIPEINRYIPNPKAYWCSPCKAHSAFDIVSSRTSEGTTSRRKCKVCGFSMFNPNAVIPWMVVLCLIGFPLLVLGLVAMVTGAGEAGSICLVIGAFPGLIGGMMLYYLKGWFAWSSAQRRKSLEELRQEALDHPFQPEAELHEKYDGDGNEGSADSSAPWFQGEEDAPSAPPPGADQEDSE